MKNTIFLNGKMKTKSVSKFLHDFVGYEISKSFDNTLGLENEMVILSDVKCFLESEKVYYPVWNELRASVVTYTEIN